MNARDLAIQLARGEKMRVSHGEYMVCCPAHEDRTPSLSVSDGEKGVVLHCHAGCKADDILAAVDLTWSEILEGSVRTEPEFTVYEYRDEAGTPLYEVVRGPDKQFRQRTRDDNERSGYRWNIRDVRRVLYHLPAVQATVRRGEEVWICEGEKDADEVRSHGVTATTNPHGAGKWREEYSQMLAGARVTIWADADEPGRVHARAVRDALLVEDCQVRIVESAFGKDAYDHLGHGLTLDDVLVTVPYDQPDTVALFLRLDEFIDKDRPDSPWVLPTLMRKGEVLVLTGFEGMGKSSLMKQFAVCAALGVHPFVPLRNFEEPQRVLYIDCENTDLDCAEDFARLRGAAREDGVYHDDPTLFIHTRSELNLEKPGDVAWLVERVNAHAPDLLVIGPVYSMIGTDLAKEDAVHSLKRAMAAVQQPGQCAVILEHHSPHAGQKEDRKVRPIGSSLMMRWPSYGFGLLPTEDGNPNEPFEFLAWRGARRRGRSWPLFVQQSGTEKAGWYWQEAQPPRGS